MKGKRNKNRASALTTVVTVLIVVLMLGMARAGNEIAPFDTTYNTYHTELPNQWTCIYWGDVMTPNNGNIANLSGYVYADANGTSCTSGDGQWANTTDSVGFESYSFPGSGYSTNTLWANWTIYVYFFFVGVIGDSTDVESNMSFSIYTHAEIVPTAGENFKPWKGQNHDVAFFNAVYESNKNIYDCCIGVSLPGWPGYDSSTGYGTWGGDVIMNYSGLWTGVGSLPDDMTFQVLTGLNISAETNAGDATPLGVTPLQGAWVFATDSGPCGAPNSGGTHDCGLYYEGSNKKHYPYGDTYHITLDEMGLTDYSFQSL